MMDDQTFTILRYILTDIATAVSRLQVQIRKLKQLHDPGEVIVSPDIKAWLETEVENLKELLKAME